MTREGPAMRPALRRLPRCAGSGRSASIFIAVEQARSRVDGAEVRTHDADFTRFAAVGVIRVQRGVITPAHPFPVS